jgi:predicted site-specific integrase-resolvase
MTPEQIEARAKAEGIAVSTLGLIAEMDVARMLKVSARTMRTWRNDGKGPAHTQLNGRVWYSCEALAAYREGK